MSKLNQLKEEIAAALAAAPGFAGTTIVTAFPGRERDYPLRQAAVAVGIDGVELAPGGFGGYYGESAEGALLGAGARITLRFDLYGPVGEGGGRLHQLYEALCGALMVDENPFGLTKLWCEDMAFDPTASANRMTARGSLPAALLRDRPEETFGAVRVTRHQEKE